MHEGLGRIINEYKEAKHASVAGLVHAIDRVMKSSVLKASC